MQAAKTVLKRRSKGPKVLDPERDDTETGSSSDDTPAVKMLKAPAKATIKAAARGSQVTAVTHWHGGCLGVGSSG